MWIAGVFDKHDAHPIVDSKAFVDPFAGDGRRDEWFCCPAQVQPGWLWRRSPAGQRSVRPGPYDLGDVHFILALFVF
jgi:hypothetical protein